MKFKSGLQISDNSLNIPCHHNDRGQGSSVRLDCPTHQAAVTAWALSPAEGEGTEGQCELEDRDKVIDNWRQNDIFKSTRSVGGRVTVEGGRGG